MFFMHHNKQPHMDFHKGSHPLPSKESNCLDLPMHFFQFGKTNPLRSLSSYETAVKLLNQSESMSSPKHTTKCHSNFLHYPDQRIPKQTLQGALPSSLQLLCSVNIRMQNTTDQNDLDDKKHVNTHPSL